VKLLRYQFLNPGEILESPDFELVRGFLTATGRTQIGWHYFIDLAWIYSQIKSWPKGYRILDAGGGRGPIQFLLAELGYNVTNLDLLLSEPAQWIKTRYRVTLETAKSYQETAYVDHLVKYSVSNSVVRMLRKAVSNSSVYKYATARKFSNAHDQWRDENGVVDEIGRLYWMKANLSRVPEIASNTFDAVVSVSAIEHIPLDSLPQAWAEIGRICKPNAKVAITTSATEQETTWFHYPSQGLCFSEFDLQSILGAHPCRGNLPASEMVEKYRACTFLKNNLAAFYSRSGENGMPWGKWDPAYFPVGVFH
jgi:ubiquinone/menaquinone biosynthesis C-methylase UbiE